MIFKNFADQDWNRTGKCHSPHISGSLLTPAATFKGELLVGFKCIPQKIGTCTYGWLTQIPLAFSLI